MSWTDALESINYLSVVAGVIISMVVGMAWYSPQLFGTSWAKMIGFKKKDLEDRTGMPVMMTMSVVFYAIVSLVLALLFAMTASEGIGEGLFLGAVVGFAFGLAPMAVTYVYARRKFELTMVDGGYIVVTCALIGAAVGWLA